MEAEKGAEIGSIETALNDIEAKRRTGKAIDGSYFNPFGIDNYSAKSALRIALKMDQEKAEVAKRTGKKLTDLNVQEKYRSDSALKPKQAPKRAVAKRSRSKSSR